jgi:hypothetical protein
MARCATPDVGHPIADDPILSIAGRNVTFHAPFSRPMGIGLSVSFPSQRCIEMRVQAVRYLSIPLCIRPMRVPAVTRLPVR